MDTATILRHIFDFIIWVVIPFILFLALFVMRKIMLETDEETHKHSLRSGFWAGTLLFVMTLIYQVAIFIKNGFPNNDIFQGFNIWLAIGAGIISFFVFLGGKQIVAPGFGGATTLVITFITWYALLHYLLIRTYNELIISLTLGISFGILSHFANPHSHARKLFRDSKN